MNNPMLNVGLQICNEHNQPIRYYDKHGENPQCEGCLIQKGELITFEQIQKKYQEKIINNNKENDLQLQYLQMLKDGILLYKENIITSLNKSIQQITDQINSIQSQQQSMQQLDNIMNQYTSIRDFTTCLKNNQKSNRQFKNQILMNLLLDIKQNIMKIDFLHTIITQQQSYIQTQVPRKIQIQELILKKQKNFQKMEYELIQQVESKITIYCFAFDKKNNNLIVGMKKGYIKIFEFKNGNVRAETQSLQAHSKGVICLYCMNNTQSFVSGSKDKLIKIWSLNELDEWSTYQILNDHKDIVNCVIMNSIEDLLISESTDLTVKFWSKLNNSWKLSQTVYVPGKKNDISLNENEDKLILCHDFNKIVVMNIQSNQEWKIIQTIKAEANGYRLCFTVQDQFVYQPTTLDYLEVYDYDEKKQQFYSKSKVKVNSASYCQNLFPCQYINNLNILTVKHGSFVNIFKVNENGKYKLIQSCEYQTCSLYGKMTNDGEYLLTWDDRSNELQVRKLKYKDEQS